MTDAVADPDLSAVPTAGAANFDRSISPISGRLGVRFGGRWMALAALVGGCGVFVAATWGADARPKASSAPDEPARQVVPFEPLRNSPGHTLANPGPDAPDLAPADASGRGVIGAGPATPDANPAAQRVAQLSAIRASPLIAFTRGSAPGEDDVSSAAALPAKVDAVATELEALRHGSTIGQARATRLPDRNFLIVAGTEIPCVLQTAMDSGAPGYVSCLISRNVFSDNGAVVLMDKGTKVLGEYRSGMRQGQRRLFVLWTRAVTPQGVAIALASPAADPLGRAGFDGDLDSHFWDRFGGALLLSIVDQGAGSISRHDLASGAVSVSSDAPSVALQNAVNIPPSLRKAQGSEVSIFVAQDFDFSNVYGLKAR